jgi:hypothetical protein
MSHDQDQDQDQAVREEHERYLRTTFGDDVFVGLLTDPPATGRRSVDTIMGDRRQAQRELRREARDQDLAVARALDLDRQAFERYIADPDRATEGDRHTAHRHATRHGLVPKRTSVDLLIQQGEQGRRIT